MKCKSLGMCVMLGVAGLLLLPTASEAQVRVGVGVRSGNVGLYAGPRPYYGGFGPGYGYGYRGYGYPGYGYPYGYGRSGVSISIGASPYYTPFVPSYGYAPYYGGSSATYLVQPQPVYVMQPTARADNTAHIEVRVPAEAKVTFDGTEMTQTGPVRYFYSPELEPGYNYSYMIRATWTADGQPVTQERKATVRAGGRYQVDLTGAALPTPRPIQP